MDRKRFVAPLLSLGAILAAVGVYLLVTMPDNEVDMPADSASPEQVVRAYTDALNAHDCDTAQKLTATPGGGAATATWCSSVKSLGDVRVSEHSQEDPAMSLRSSAGEVVSVGVTFDLSWRAGRDDGSMGEGHTDWRYVLERSSPTEPWRILDQGNG